MPAMRLAVSAMDTLRAGASHMTTDPYPTTYHSSGKPASVLPCPMPCDGGAVTSVRALKLTLLRDLEIYPLCRGARPPARGLIPDRYLQGVLAGRRVQADA